MQPATSMADRLALHTWTLDTTPLEAVLRAARETGWPAVELRRVDFTRAWQAGRSTEEVLDLVRMSGLKVATVGVEYGWLFARGEERRRLFAVMDETCRVATALGCHLVMSAPGSGLGYGMGTLREAAESLREAGDVVARHGLRLAFEFSSAHELIDTLDKAREVVAMAQHPSCGLLIDAYHLERSGRGGRGFESLAPEEIFYVQYSDVPPTPPENVPRPQDRLAPGQGVVRFHDFFGLLREKGYQGYLSYEAPNPATWARDPGLVLSEALEATREIIAEVEAGA